MDKTPFYAESGGQLSDEGTISTKEGEFRVDRTFQVNQVIIHQGTVTKGEIKKGQATARVDGKRRQALARAHTATHLLQAALRQVLGEHVVQQGSLVDEDRFRFDFTHFNRLTDEEIEKVESLVSKFISRADKVEKEELNLEDARKQGALAFFKEKYHNMVRMVAIGGYSKELCGGTHVDNTSQIEKFIIVSESSISSGIRRIEALVGKEDGASLLARRKEKAKAKKASEEKKKADREKVIKAASALESQFISSDTKGISGVESLDGINVLVRVFEPEESLKDSVSKVMLAFSDKIKQKAGSLLVFIATKGCKKDTFICSATNDIIEKGFSCKKFISESGKELSLAGGGNERKVQGVVLKMDEGFRSLS